MHALVFRGDYRIASFKKEAREMLLFSQLHDWLKCRARSGSFATVPQGQ